MLDLFLKAATEADLKAALPWAVNEEGEWIKCTHTYALDPIGPVIITPAAIDTEGNLASEAVFDTAFHANLRLLDHDLAAEVPDWVRITVASPTRVWA